MNNLTPTQQITLNNFYKSMNFGFDSKNVTITKITENQVFFTFNGENLVYTDFKVETDKQPTKAQINDQNGEKLTTILTTIKNNIETEKENFIKNYQDEFKNGDSETIQFLTNQLTAIETATTKNLKKLKDITEFLNIWLYQ